MKRRNVLPPGCSYFTDARGKLRARFRKAGQKTVYPKSEPGTPEFMAEYDAFARGVQPAPAGQGRSLPGTIAGLAARFYSSAEWHGLKPTTQATYRGIIERFRVEHGDKRVAKLRREDIKALLDRKSRTPAAANNWLRIVRALMQYAIEIGWLSDNPTAGVKPVKNKTEGFAIWQEQHIEAFRARHALGTRARLALELLLGTIQRRGDAVRMGRQHVKAGTLSIVQEKTGMLVEVPILPELQAALDATPNGHLTFLTTESGKAFTSAGFGNWFREVCNEAGLPAGYAAHGLRKAGATRLADAGASDHEIMAWGGWTTIKEVQRYTKAANRKRNAINGAAKLKERTNVG